MRILQILSVLIFLSFSFDSFSQEEDSGEDTLVTLYLNLVDLNTGSVISNAEIIITTERDTVIKHTNLKGEIIHELDTNLNYKVTINSKNRLPSVDKFTTIGIVSKTYIVREISVGMGCRSGLFN